MLLGHWIEMKAVLGASSDLEELAALLPSEALLLDEEDNTRSIALEELKKDDLVLVKPGEKVPADGTIEEGQSQVNESLLTGESMPVSKGEGDDVIGGSINQKGSLKVRISNTGDDAFLSRVMHMVEEARSKKSKTQNLANKAAGWLFYLALGSGIITFSVWANLGRDLAYAMERMVTVMVISCPHALGLAIPLVVAISTSFSARHGLLVRNRTAFENARKITTLLFDKTGTLTRGEFGVTRYKSSSEGLEDDAMLGLAAAVEHSSEHPIAAGIVAKAEKLELETGKAGKVESITGKGIKAEIDGHEYRMVSPGYLEEKDLPVPEGAYDSEAETVVFLVEGTEVLGHIALADEVREEAKSAVKTLKKKDIRVVMVTGDNEQVAKAVSTSLGLDAYHAGVLPEEKQQLVKKLQEQGEFVAMTGDGINDAPALAEADVGIAVGSGTDLAAESADIVLVNSNPKDIARLVLFGTATYRKMVQNLLWAAGYNIFAIPLAAGVLAGAGILLSPAAGAVLMSLSTVVVAVNAQLLKRTIKK
jgi:Cu2+-exporting ATPase